MLDRDALADRRMAAIAAIVAVGRACTCYAGSDIMTCPNYMPGDEAPDAFEEESE